MLKPYQNHGNRSRVTPAAGQQPAPSPGSPIDRLMRDFTGATAERTFLEDGLHAVVTIRRKPAGN